MSWSIAGLVFAITQISAPAAAGPAESIETETPIKHLVVIFQENQSFFTYFATYPEAENPKGADAPPQFEARPGTPSVNGIDNSLANFNPNQVNPFRIARLDSYVCDQNHDYTAELQARNQGLMDKYVEFGARGAKDPIQFCPDIGDGMTSIADMGYFDGNTVTGLWNYAQHFAISDNFFATMNGESTRGHLNLIKADAYGALCTEVKKPEKVWVDPIFPVEGVPPCNGPAMNPDDMPDTNGNLGTLVDDADPYWDVCSEAEETVAMSGRNIGNLLNDHDVPWGWFQDGFRLPENGDCTQNQHFKEVYCAAIGNPSDCTSVMLVDYVAHHNPFQYYQSTSNLKHLPPTRADLIGLNGDQANHLYDLADFWTAANNGNLPAVSFLKAANYQDGHPGQSDPLDEQFFIINILNQLQQLEEWESMAIFLAWDDSDGWYDQVMPPIINQSSTDLDLGEDGQLLCGDQGDPEMNPGARCVYGPRLPFLVVSPFAKENYVSHVLNDQTSITRFIEDNWLGGERISDGENGFPESFDAKAGSLMDIFDFSRADQGKGHKKQRTLFLDPMTGEVIKKPPN